MKTASVTNNTFDSSSVQELIEKRIIDLKIYDTEKKHASIYGLDSDKPLFIESFCIDENERLKGIGKTMLEYIDEYAINNGNDLIFGHINRKSSFNKDERQTTFSDVEMIKYWLHRNGYSINENNNDFHKVVIVSE